MQNYKSSIFSGEFSKKFGKNKTVSSQIENRNQNREFLTFLFWSRLGISLISFDIFWYLKKIRIFVKLFFVNFQNFEEKNHPIFMKIFPTGLGTIPIGIPSENPLEFHWKMFQNSEFITSHLRIFRNF
jgi:uncharacterized membrane protein YidH (DUF202 family)